MYSPVKLAAKYIRYYITAANGKGHGIHSPFVFDFITCVLNDKRTFYPFSKIEARRSQLLFDERKLKMVDFGAGSAAGNPPTKTVRAIAKYAAKSPRLCKLLFRIVNHYQPDNIVELGTSLGLSGAYLAMANPVARFVTLEGAPEIAEVAKETFTQLHIKNAEVRTGNFDEGLAAVLVEVKEVDLAFVDGNHRAAPTLRYFEQLLESAGPCAIMIFDDIHWSADMERAWAQIKAHPGVMLTIDLFFLGLVFINSDFKVKQDFVIRF